MDMEQDILAAGADKAPRVTPQDIKDNIVSEHYFTAEDGVIGASLTTISTVSGYPDKDDSLSRLTFCVLVLRNGFMVTGESACASPENFNAEIGRRIARENAIEKIWPLMGYELLSKLTAKDSGSDVPEGTFGKLTGQED